MKTEFLTEEELNAKYDHIQIWHDVPDSKFWFSRELYDADFSSEKYTIFFYRSKRTFYRKYVFFGPKIEYDEPVEAFSIDCDIYSPSLTKDELRAVIIRKYNLLKRANEIKNKQFI